MIKHVEYFANKLPIGFPALIFGILFNQKNDIVIVEDEISVLLSLLNFSFNIFVGKHVPDIILPNFSNFDESDLTAGDNGIEVSIMFEPIRSLILNVIMPESKFLQVMNPKVVDTYTSQDAI